MAGFKINIRSRPSATPSTRRFWPTRRRHWSRWSCCHHPNRNASHHKGSRCLKWHISARAPRPMRPLALPQVPSDRGAPLSWAHVDYLGMASEPKFSRPLTLMSVIYLLFALSTAPHTGGDTRQRDSLLGMTVSHHRKTIVF
jgi:hypothetical protein